MKKISFLLVCWLLLAACGEKTAESQTLTVYAAASLTDAFEELGTAFETQQAGVTIEFNFAASNTLATQLKEGARADIFASANQAQMQTIVEASLNTTDPQLFVTNRLVVAVWAESPLQTLNDLASAGIKLVVAAPEVPVRTYTEQAFEKLSADTTYGSDFVAQVRANIVSEEPNVRQVVVKIALGEADAGIVYQSDITPDLAAQVRLIPIPEAYNILAEYPIVALTERPLASQFIDFILSEAGQAILQKWGFSAAEQG